MAFNPDALIVNMYDTIDIDKREHILRDRMDTLKFIVSTVHEELGRGVIPDDVLQPRAQSLLIESVLKDGHSFLNRTNTGV